MEIARRVRVGENRSDAESELELEDPLEMGDDMISFEDERGREVIVTSVERREPMATSAGGEWEVDRRDDVPVRRKRAASLNAASEREAKRTRSPRPSEASPASSPPTPGAVG